MPVDTAIFVSVIVFGVVLIAISCGSTFVITKCVTKQRRRRELPQAPNSTERSSDERLRESETLNSECWPWQRRRFPRMDPRIDCMIIPSYGGTLPPGAIRKRNLNLRLLPGVETDLDNIERMIYEDNSKELVSVRSQFRDIHMDVARCKECIGEIMKRTHRKSTSNGLLIWYTGHGEACTGNWPFGGGYLTFSDMYELYKRHMQGKHLYIVTDCCYSGNWVKECARHLDKENIYCGHDAEERKIYLKVFASCLPDQEATDPLYTTGKGVRLCKHRESHVIAFSRRRKLNHDQTTLGFDFTQTKKCIVDGNKCVSAESTWEQDVDDLIQAGPNHKYSI